MEGKGHKATREDDNAALRDDPKISGESHSPRTGNTAAPSLVPDDATDHPKVEEADTAKLGGSKEYDAVYSTIVGKTGQSQELPAQTMRNGVSSLSHVKTQVISDF